MRSGTDNVPGIAGLGVAAEMVYTDFDKKIQHLYDLKERMAEGLSKAWDITINGMPFKRRGTAHHERDFSWSPKRSPAPYTGRIRVYIFRRKCSLVIRRKPSATLTAMGLSRADGEYRPHQFL